MRALCHLLGAMLEGLRRDVLSIELRGAHSAETLRVIASVLLAVTLATLLHLDDLFWAAITGYIVMKGDFRASLKRGAMRCVGTWTGALAGFVLAHWTADDPVALMACLFAFCWIGTMQSFLSPYSYAWIFFAVTGSLVTVYSEVNPDALVHIAATRAAEITVGTLACLVVAAFGPAGVRASGAPRRFMEGLRLRDLRDEAWLRAHWPLVIHATRSAVALALQPVLWRALELTNFTQGAITSFIVLIVPMTEIHTANHRAIHDRMIHRLTGCLAGSVCALVLLSCSGDDFMTTLLTLAIGIFVGNHVEKNRHGVGYVGTQFVVGFLMTYIQGPAPAASIWPGLDRLGGILVGCVTAFVMVSCWPLRSAPPVAETGQRS